MSTAGKFKLTHYPYSQGLRGDEAAMAAIRLAEDRRAANALETSRQKVAEIELKAAQERRAAESIALTREREAREAQQQRRPAAS